MSYRHFVVSGRKNLTFSFRLTESELLLLRTLFELLRDRLAGRSASAPFDELAELTGLRTGHTEAPTDPVLARLLPDFVNPGSGKPGSGKPGSGEPDAEQPADDRFGFDDGADRLGFGDDIEVDNVDLNAALRSLNEPELIDAKSGALERTLAVLDGGTNLKLSETEADDFAAALNDVRLWLAVDLGIETPVLSQGRGPEPADDGFGVREREVYDWASAVLESLMEARLDSIE